MKRIGQIAALALAGCAGARSPAAPPTPKGTSAVAAGDVAQSTSNAGKQVVETVCASCHSLQPPANKAPPLSMVAMRYRMRMGDDVAAAARIAAWIASPDTARALMPPMAIQRFGLMPPLPLPDSVRLAAARYVLSLSPSGMGGMGMGGRGMMHGMRRP